MMSFWMRRDDNILVSYCSGEFQKNPVVQVASSICYLAGKVLIRSHSEEQYTEFCHQLLHADPREMRATGGHVIVGGQRMNFEAKSEI
jgi:hypothetical protein